MQMPFNIWQDPCPARLFVLRIRHDIYYQLHCIYRKLYCQLKLNQNKPEELPLLIALNHILVTGLTLPLPSLNDFYDVLKKSLHDFSAYNTALKELKQELEDILPELQHCLETPVFLALEHLFLNNPLTDLADKELFNFSLKYSRDFCRIKSVFHDHGFDTFSQLYLWKEIVKQGSNHPLILTGPLSWHQHALKIPPAKIVILITPCWYSTQIESNNPFTTYADITIGLNSDALILPAQTIILPLHTNTRPEQEQFINEEILSEYEPDVDLKEEPLSQLKLANNWVTIETGKKQIIIDSDNQIRHDTLYSTDQLTTGEYWVDFENKNESDRITSPDEKFIAQMEVWKVPMRLFEKQPNLLVKKLKHYGATACANEQNVCDWMKPSHDRIHAPQNLEYDFIAILQFVGIPSEQHQDFIQLIKKSRLTNRWLGRASSFDSKNQVLSELNSLLSSILLTDNETLELHTDNYIYYLRKITDIN